MSYLPFDVIIASFVALCVCRPSSVRFDKKSFDGMLEWFGEPKSGCHFDRVETANHGPSGYEHGAGHLLDASKCQLLVG